MENEEIPTLSIMREIANNHGGKILKKSFGDKGTQFVFKFLAAEANLPQFFDVAEQSNSINALSEVG